MTRQRINMVPGIQLMPFLAVQNGLEHVNGLHMHATIFEARRPGDAAGSLGYFWSLAMQSRNLPATLSSHPGNPTAHSTQALIAKHTHLEVLLGALEGCLSLAIQSRSLPATLF
jgi:hypothetical protein